MSVPDRAPDVAGVQGEAHGDGHDYVTGSPHLRHAPLSTMIRDQLTALVDSTVTATGSCHVLEIGAGHGTFTQMLLDAGARVTVTETSAASAQHLAETYRLRDDVTVLHDVTGHDVLARTDRFDAVVCASLLHHVPDYLAFVDDLTGLVATGGWFYSVQDPIFYPRRTRASHLASRGTYFLWRLGQGAWRRGLSTRVRRLRRTWSDTEPSDLVEYHVMRDGVDELALVGLLRGRFGDAEVFTYWSTQSPLWQRVFARTRLRSDFGLIARDRVASWL